VAHPFSGAFQQLALSLKSVLGARQANLRWEPAG
jgi:hypothetical protein